MSDLKIQVIDIDESKFNKAELDPFVFPSLTILNGTVASGKSTVCSNFIRITQPVFDGNVILISPTIKNDPILLKLIDDDVILEYYEEYSNSLLQNIMKIIQEDPDEKSKYLLVFDDILSQLPKTNTRDARWFDSFISTYRHGGNMSGAREGSVSLLFSTQYYNELTPTLKLNCSYLCLLGKYSIKRLNYFGELFGVFTSESGSIEDFIRVYNEAKEGNVYNFLTLDLRKIRALRNFEEILYERKN